MIDEEKLEILHHIVIENISGVGIVMADIGNNAKTNNDKGGKKKR